MTPPPWVPWPDTVSQYHLYAFCSQMRSEDRRRRAREEWGEVWHLLKNDIKAAGVVLGCIAVIAALWFISWGLFVLVGA